MTLVIRLGTISLGNGMAIVPGALSVPVPPKPEEGEGNEQPEEEAQQDQAEAANQQVQRNGTK